MIARASLRIAYADEATARAVLGALAPDNAPHATARLEGATLHAQSQAPSPGALLHTLDDLLACLSTAEKAVAVARAPPRQP